MPPRPPRSALRRAAARTTLISCVVAVASGCANSSRLPAVPLEHAQIPSVPGYDPAIRWWGDDASDATFNTTADSTITRERAYRASIGEPGIAPSIAYLAVSGGGEDGAFAAGLLCGWSETGTRPEFNVVTGVSTGALIAPFAFLGPDYDHVLREVYTTITTTDVLTKRPLIEGILTDALADAAPLRRIVEKHVTDEVVRRIAELDARGHLLLIATTNLDAARPVVWNLGAIAADPNPDRRQLIIDVMIASAAIPSVLPPMLLGVTVNDVNYQEMHVDGGAANQVFIFAPGFQLSDFADRNDAKRERTAYIIRNDRPEPKWAESRARTIDIARRSVAALIEAQGMGDLYRLYLGCQRDGVGYRLAMIPSSFTEAAKEPFDREYMQELFAVGLAEGRKGGNWREAPPGFTEAPLAPPKPSDPR